jgi:hypothetical protein
VSIVAPCFVHGSGNATTDAFDSPKSNPGAPGVTPKSSSHGTRVVSLGHAKSSPGAPNSQLALKVPARKRSIPATSVILYNITVGLEASLAAYRTGLGTSTRAHTQVLL